MTGSSSTDERQADIDLVVVGAGAGGMVAALVAALEGLRVVLCEGSQQVGGTTATSAGTLWIPGNRHGAEAGHADSVQAAASYLDALIGPDDGRQLRQAFLESGDAAIAYLEERTDVAFVSAGQHPDYLALPGAAIAGRALAPRPFDGRLLRGAFARIRPPMPEFLLLGGMMVGKADIQALVRRWQSWPAFVASAGLVARYLVDRIRYPRGTRLVMGNALVARLFYSLQRAGVDVRFGWRLRELTVEGGKVRGATFAVDGQERRLDSRAGVVLATGGVGHGEALRAELAPAGMSLPSLACDAVNGEGITAARSAGAGSSATPPATSSGSRCRACHAQVGQGFFPIFSWTAPSRAWLPWTPRDAGSPTKRVRTTTSWRRWCATCSAPAAMRPGWSAMRPSCTSTDWA